MIPFDEPLIYEDITYLSVENFYQAMKLDNIEDKKYIASLPPRKSKTQIRKYNIRNNWDMKEKIKVMQIALNHKFNLSTSWGKKLLETGDDEIIEWNNWHDLFWGKDIETKEGLNHLGQLLMNIRSRLNIELTFK